jgi:protein TonB
MSAENRVLARTAAASLLLHAALVLAPGSWWEGLIFPEAPGRAGSRPEGPLTVSLVPWGPASAAGPPRPEPLEAAPPAPAVAASPAEAPPPAEAPSGIPPRTPAVTGTGGAGASDPAAGSPAATAPGSGATGELRYRPPKLLAGALPLTPEESEGLPSPLEISVRLRVDRRGRVAEVVPGKPDLPAPLREALERSARAMRFVPARLGGEPVEAWFEVSFVYRR